MTVLERLDAIREPMWSETDYESWRPFGEEFRAIHAVDWRPRRLLVFKGVMRERFREAMRGWSLRHLYRNLQSTMLDAIKQCTPEMEWFRSFPSAEIQPAGKENRIVWGKS